jgi:hypothetical protein
LHHFSSYLQRIDADKTRSGIWNSKFCDFLWRTSNGSHPKPHKTRYRNIEIAPFILVSWEKDMLRKRFQEVGIQYFEVIYEEQVMALIRIQTKHDFET